ncbi:EscN/YscN/HrcN family type III secretion system ATPase, partial [Paraburkholderia sp. UYCP14C]
SKHREVELLLQIGEYQAGGNPLADEAIRKIDAIRAFFNQATHEFAAPQESEARLFQLAND